VSYVDHFADILFDARESVLTERCCDCVEDTEFCWCLDDVEGSMGVEGLWRVVRFAGSQAVDREGTVAVLVNWDVDVGIVIVAEWVVPVSAQPKLALSPRFGIKAKSRLIETHAMSQHLYHVASPIIVIRRAELGRDVEGSGDSAVLGCHSC